MFAPAYREVSVMLYQKLWNDFKAIGMEQRLAGSSSSKDLMAAAPSNASVPQSKPAPTPSKVSGTQDSINKVRLVSVKTASNLGSMTVAEANEEKE